jgi:hypothetical protein
MSETLKTLTLILACIEKRKEKLDLFLKCIKKLTKNARLVS